jgi:hypothetical protein
VKELDIPTEAVWAQWNFVDNHAWKNKWI